MLKTVGIIGGGPVGLFMSRLLLMFGIDNIVFEKNIHRNQLAKAHFLNMRSMEILQSTLPNIHRQIRNIVPPSSDWRNYVYSYSVLGPEFQRVDHFSDHRFAKWMDSCISQYHLRPSLHVSEAIAHISQRKLEDILQADLSTVSYGVDVSQICAKDSFVNVVGTDNQLLAKCEYLVVADGSSGSISKQLKNHQRGIVHKKSDVQHIVNISFRVLDPCIWVKSTSPAMLYFIFNETICCVVVRHGMDEGVCQLPYFPDIKPFQLLRAAFGLPVNSSNDFVISSISPWSVSPPQVSERFSFDLSHVSEVIKLHNDYIWHIGENLSSDMHDKIFLVGDAAHTFPPAGGFGLNTGLQDAHNLAWKIALHSISRSDLGNSNRLLSSYETERRPVCIANADLSWQNYSKIRHLTEELIGVPENSSTTIAAALSSMSPLIAEIGLKVGFAPLAQYRCPNPLSERNLKRIFDAHKIGKNDIEMLYPEHDIGFKYTLLDVNQDDKMRWGVIDSCACFSTGRRLSHVLVDVIKANSTERKTVSMVNILAEFDSGLHHVLMLFRPSDSLLRYLEDLEEKAYHLDIVVAQGYGSTAIASRFGRLFSCHLNSDDAKCISDIPKGLAVLVRPDGHVSCIFSIGDEFHRLESFVKKIVMMD